jgi:hypothetical protein
MYVALALVAAFNLGSTLYVLATSTRHGLIDFNPYWYSGLFIRQGVNPYEGFLRHLELSLPISHLDGGTSTSSTTLSRPSRLQEMPANLAPFVLIVTPFSFLSLKSAVSLWTALNVGLAILIPLAVLRYLKLKGLVVPTQLLPPSVLVFLGLNMTARGGIGNGQPSLLIFLFMLLALIWVEEGRLVLAGIALGLALSKYNVAFPVLVFLLLKRQWKAVLIALVVQLSGIVALSLLTKSSPSATLSDYVSIAVAHATRQISSTKGINISDYLPQGLTYSILSFASTAIPIAALCHYAMRKAARPRTEGNLTEVNLLSILLLWITLAVYNLGYNVILAIFPILLFGLILESPRHQGLSSRALGILTVLYSFAFALLALPGRVYRHVFGLDIASNAAMTVSIVILLLTSTWMLFATEARSRPGRDPAMAQRPRRRQYLNHI